MAEFFEQPKIARFNRPVIVTEKIDGTNAGVLVHEDGRVEACSKNRVLRPGEPDNFGFRAWVETKADELRTLGHGLHRGEWWGKGIQRHYGCHEKRFSLFNVQRWRRFPDVEDVLDLRAEELGLVRVSPPPCCDVVPVLGVTFIPNTSLFSILIDGLRVNGSVVFGGFMRPEGIVIFHTAQGNMFKITLEHDEKPKRETKNA